MAVLHRRMPARHALWLLGAQRWSPRSSVAMPRPLQTPLFLFLWGGGVTYISEFGILRKRYWGRHLWAREYWVVSSGNVTDEMWAEYIKNQTPLEPDDSFNVI
jgi:REP element-mobilizing transposase RayT